MLLDAFAPACIVLTYPPFQRDATQRETLSQTIRTLHADALRHTTDIERLSTKNTEAARKLGIAEASERAFKLQIRGAEQAARGLKDEMTKMKVLVAQTRSQCANEVRKRERVIEGLKKHVGEGGRARGSGKAVGVVSVTVVPGVGEGSANAGGNVEDPSYDLRSETNEFLTELARGLSEENEHVGALLRRTVDTLRTLSGWEKETIEQEGGMVVNHDGAYENISEEMGEVIEHLRTLLTNPSFVPLEEVEVREEEIVRLREGWEKMESRWMEAVKMMEGWRKRMARSGQTVNLEELRFGLSLSPLKPKEEEYIHDGFQLSTLMEEDGEGDTQADIDAMDDSGIAPPELDEFDEEPDFDESDSSMFEEDPAETVIPQEEEFEEELEAELEEEEEEIVEEATFNTVSSGSPGPAPQLSPLRETSGNRVILHPNGPQKENFTTIVEENTLDLLELVDSPKKEQKPVKTTPKVARIPTPTSSFGGSSQAEDEVSLLRTSDSIPPPKSQPARQISPQRRQPPQQKSPQKSSSRPTPRRQILPATPKLRTDASSRLPRPQNERNVMPQQSPLTMATIAAKLAATEREADAARVRAKIKAARMGKTNMAPPALPASVVSSRKEAAVEEAEEEKPVEGEVTSRKRKATGRTQGGRANRRRSTLSPWEMESLILGGVGSPLKAE